SVNNTICVVTAAATLAAGIATLRWTAASAGSWIAGTYLVVNGLITGRPLPCVTHSATVQGRTLPSIFTDSVGEPLGMVICRGAVILGGTRFVPGVVMVNNTLFDIPDAFDTEMLAVPGK